MQIRVTAGVVVYFPDWPLLEQLIRVLVASADKVLIFANSALSSAEREQVLNLAESSRIEILQSNQNVGLGRAYNHLIARARSLEANAIFLCDQDSGPSAETIRSLVHNAYQLSAKGQRVAVVGPRPISPRLRGAEFKSVHLFKRGRHGHSARVVAADFVISSGSLILLDAFDKVGLFREDFFIDGIDIEWCFRAWSKGYSCWIVLDALMEHRLGRGMLTVPFTGFSVPIQPPYRLYTYVRNQIHMLGFNHVPLRWKIKVVPYIVLQALVYALKGRHRRMSLAAFWRGVRDGTRLMRRDLGIGGALDRMRG